MESSVLSVLILLFPIHPMQPDANIPALQMKRMSSSIALERKSIASLISVHHGSSLWGLLTLTSLAGSVDVAL